MRVDLDKFPDHVTSTSLRPDIVLSSVSSRQVLLIEPTVPLEDRIEEANERKQVPGASRAMPENRLEGMLRAH